MNKRQVTSMLRRYDRLKDELADLERDLNKAVADYGVSTGRWCFNKDQFRAELERERNQTTRKQAHA